MAILRQNDALLRPILFGTVAASSLVPTGTRKNKLWCLHVLHFVVRPLGTSNGPSCFQCSLPKLNSHCARTRRCYVLSCLDLLQHHLWCPQGQGRTNFGVSMSYILWCGRWGRLMGPGASKWRLRKSNDNCARTMRCYVISCLELLQHHLWYPQGQGRTNFGVSMSYILWCGRWGRLMGPGASKWRMRKTNGNIDQNDALLRVLSCLEQLQLHLWYPQGQRRTNFGVSMSYILWCGRWGRLIGPGASKCWHLRKLNGNIAPERCVATSYPVWNCCRIIFGTHRDKEEQTLVSPCLTFCGAAVGDV